MARHSYLRLLPLEILKVEIFFQHEYVFEELSDQGPVSRKSQKLFGPEKPFVKLPTACFGKPVF